MAGKQTFEIDSSNPVSVTADFCSTDDMSQQRTSVCSSNVYGAHFSDFLVTSAIPAQIHHQRLHFPTSQQNMSCNAKTDDSIEKKKFLRSKGNAIMTLTSAQSYRFQKVKVAFDAEQCGFVRIIDIILVISGNLNKTFVHLSRTSERGSGLLHELSTNKKQKGHAEPSTNLSKTNLFSSRSRTWHRSGSISYKVSRYLNAEKKNDKTKLDLETEAGELALRGPQSPQATPESSEPVNKSRWKHLKKKFRDTGQTQSLFEMIVPNSPPPKAARELTRGKSTIVVDLIPERESNKTSTIDLIVSQSILKKPKNNEEYDLESDREKHNKTNKKVVKIMESDGTLHVPNERIQRHSTPDSRRNSIFEMKSNNRYEERRTKTKDGGVSTHEDRLSNVPDEGPSNTLDDKRSNISADKQSSISDDKRSSISADKWSNISDDKQSSISDDRWSNISSDKGSNISDDKRSNISNNKRPLILDDRRPSISDDRLPSISDDRLPSISDDRLPSIYDDRRPSISDDKRPSISDDRRPSISDDRRPSISDDRRPSISDDRLPSILDDKRQSISDDKRASISDDKQASISDDKRASISDDKRASISDDKRASISDDKRASMSDDKRPSISDDERSNASEFKGQAKTTNRRAAIASTSKVLFTQVSPSNALTKQKPDAIAKTSLTSRNNNDTDDNLEQTKNNNKTFLDEKNINSNKTNRPQPMCSDVPQTMQHGGNPSLGDCTSSISITRIRETINNNYIVDSFSRNNRPTEVFESLWSARPTRSFYPIASGERLSTEILLLLYELKQIRLQIENLRRENNCLRKDIELLQTTNWQTAHQQTKNSLPVTVLRDWTLTLVYAIAAGFLGMTLGKLII